MNANALRFGHYVLTITVAAVLAASDAHAQTRYTATPIPAPVLLVNANTNRAIALDSVLFTAEPFSLVSSSNFNADQRTRVMLFARNVDLAPNETFSVVTAKAVDSGSNVYTLAVEYVGRVPDFDGLTTVIVKLPNNLTFNGDVSISISLRGVPSNNVVLAIRVP